MENYEFWRARQLGFQKLQRQFERLDTRADDLRVDYESSRSLQFAVNSVFEMARSSRRPDRGRARAAAERSSAMVDAMRGAGQVIVVGGPHDPEQRAAVVGEFQNLIVELAINRGIVPPSASFDHAMKAVLRQVTRQSRKAAGRVSFSLEHPCEVLARLAGDWGLRAYRLETQARKSERARRHTRAPTPAAEATPATVETRLNPSAPRPPTPVRTGGSSLPVETETIIDEKPQPSHVFRRLSEGWEVKFAEEKRVGLRDLKGMELIRRLLANPGQLFSATELLGRNVAPDGSFQNAGFSGDDVLDRTAIRNYEQRIRELDEKIEIANDVAATTRVSDLEEEKKAIYEELKKQRRPSGRPRRLDVDKERNRKAAWKLYDRALRQLRREAPILAAHLGGHIKPGNEFLYQSEECWMT
jgi:hypothetical protein